MAGLSRRASRWLSLCLLLLGFVLVVLGILVATGHTNLADTTMSVVLVTLTGVLLAEGSAKRRPNPHS